MDKNVLDIALDLGGDTVKVTFAFNKGEQINYGKIVSRSKLTNIAIPAIGYYDVQKGEWSFGNKVDNNNDSFITVVKIKDLLSLLIDRNDKEINSFNNASYFYGNNFPKFFFPIRKKMLDDFNKMVDCDYTFIAPKFTPQKVCEAFFVFIKGLIDERIGDLEKSADTVFDDRRISLVHPSNVGDAYLDELSSIIKKVFKKTVYKVLSSNKALSMFAYYKNIVKEKESFLVFDMGEESIRVVRATIENKQILIDGVEGHNEPSDFGGNDIDEAIVTYLEKTILNREMIGASNNGENDRVQEHSVFNKQYLLMKDIKKAKIIFSKDVNKDSIFYNGVPVTVSRDIYIQRKITKEQMCDAIGITGDCKIAKDICDYIISEIERPVNSDINKVLLAGGIAETYALVDYIKGKIKESGSKAKILTFDSASSFDKDFDIMEYEDSVFASAVGCSIIALKNIDIKTLVSLSYATWAISNVLRKKVLTIFVDRGTPISEKGSCFAEHFNVGGEGVPKGEEMFSTFVTRKMLLSDKMQRLGYIYDGKPVIGDPCSSDRRRAERDLDLKVVSGGTNGRIIFTYNKEQIRIFDDERIFFDEGILVDKNGKAKPYLKNTSGHQLIWALNDNGSRLRVFKDEIKVEFSGVDGFVVSND